MRKRLSYLTLMFLLLSAGAAPVSADAQTREPSRWMLTYNPGDLVFGFITVEGQRSISRHWSGELSLRVNPFPTGYSDIKQVTLTVNPNAVHWFFFPASGWWVSAGPQYRFRTFIERSDGWHDLGLAFAGGYSLMVHKNVNLNFGLGGWLGGEFFPNEFNMWNRWKPDRYGAFFMEWDRLIVGITYVF